MKKALLSLTVLAASQTALANAIPDKLAEDAFIYAYSIDEAYKFFYETAVETDTPLNRFQNIRHIADDTYTAHVTINNDTLHLMGWLDVAAEPVIVSIPDMDKGRYWILHTMDMGHYTTSMIGSRLRGNEGGSFMFASRSWQGDVPASVDEVIRVDSNLLKLTVLHFVLLLVLVLYLQNSLIIHVLQNCLMPIQKIQAVVFLLNIFLY